jgi:NADH-quinone oxidoreductase subunit F
VPWIIREGGQKYLEIGKPNNGGTKIFSVVGDVEKPGNFEIPLGTPFSKLLELAGGVKGGRALKAVIPGGSSAPVLPAATMMDITMDYDAIAKAGSMLGSGAVIVMDETRCMVKSLLRLSYFYMHESCGQCTPCREGTGWLWRMVDRIEHGQGKMSDIDLLNGGRQHPGPHHLRARRRGGDAGARHDQALPRRVRAPRRAQALRRAGLRLNATT